MGVIKMLKKSKDAPTITSSAMAVASSQTDDRSQLKFFTAELKKAEAAVVDLEQRVARLEKVIVDAEVAHSALQSFINADGGLALAEYSAGRADNSDIAKLISADETTARAAHAAKAALLNAQSALANARAEVVRLNGRREAAVLQYLTQRADERAKSYMLVWNAFCRAHDNLVGISTALSSGDYGGEILMTRAPIVAPRFNLPSSADSHEYLPTMTHLADDHAVESAAGDWLEARRRLTENVDADLDDLVGPSV
jgi:hypothetical protein